MLELFAWWFKVKGWRIDEQSSLDIKRGIMIAAPHTSNWDFVYALGALKLMNIPVQYLAKKELFRPPLGWLLKAAGGIPVERKKNTKFVDVITEKFKEHQDLILMMAAEGTRKRVEKWKTGFYYAALNANVPVYPAYLDYRKKMAGIGPAIWLTGNKDQDARTLRTFYRDKDAKFPVMFNIDAIRFSE